MPQADRRHGRKRRPCDAREVCEQQTVEEQKRADPETARRPGDQHAGARAHREYKEADQRPCRAIDEQDLGRVPHMRPPGVRVRSSYQASRPFCGFAAMAACCLALEQLGCCSRLKPSSRKSSRRLCGRIIKTNTGR